MPGPGGRRGKHGCIMHCQGVGSAMDDLCGFVCGQIAQTLFSLPTNKQTNCIQSRDTIGMNEKRGNYKTKTESKQNVNETQQNAIIIITV